MSGPRFLPSGRRLGPYWEMRREASPASSPFAGSVFSRPNISSAGTACQDTASPLGLARITVSMMHSLSARCTGLMKANIQPKAQASEPKVRTSKKAGRRAAKARSADQIWSLPGAPTIELVIPSQRAMLVVTVEAVQRFGVVDCRMGRRAPPWDARHFLQRRNASKIRQVEFREDPR
jgi:hypothetical protein